MDDIVSDKYVNNYEYGLLIRRKKNLKTNNKHLILNSGIVVEQASLESIFGKNFRRSNYGHDTYRGEGTYNDIIVNFPSNWLQLDVARENITGFSNVINEKNYKKRPYSLGVKIASSLYKQILQYIEYSQQTKTNIPAICLQDVIQYALDFCGNQTSEEELREKLLKLKYGLLIKFSDKGLSYQLIRSEKPGERIRIRYSGEDARKEREKWMYKFSTQDVEIDQRILKQMEREGKERRKTNREIMRLFEEIIHRNRIYSNNEQMRFRAEYLLREMPSALKIEGDDKNIFRFLSILLLNIPDRVICNSDSDISTIVLVLETVFLQYFCIGSETTQEIKIEYNELMEFLYIREK